MEQYIPFSLIICEPFSLNLETLLYIHASILQQDNNFTNIYVKNNNFVPHNLIYKSYLLMDIE